MAYQVQDDDICIVGLQRTPIGSFQGTLASLTGVQLASHAIRAALEQSGVSASHVDQVYLGNVLPAGLGQAPCKQAAMGAGIPATCPCTLVNKVCASGMKAIMLGAMSIRCGDAQVVVTGGFESMSNVPFIAPSHRKGTKYGHAQLYDGLAFDGLEDPSTHQPMGVFGERCASNEGISRARQDAYAAESYRRAVEAANQGLFNGEICPVTVQLSRGKSTIVEHDEECTARPVDKGSLDKLRPAFTKTDGTVTAGNASTLSDGAAACVLVRGSYAVANGLVVKAVVRGWSDASNTPEDFPTAPAKAIPLALGHAKLTPDQVDVYEINEAFSVVALANMDKLNLAHESVNVFGGAVSLGHPLGCSGARIVCTLYSVLSNRKATTGVASICNGGGGASALVIQRVNAAAQRKQAYSYL